MKCPNCGSKNCYIVNGLSKSRRKQSVFRITLRKFFHISAKNIDNTYWLCSDCGNKWGV